MNKMVLAMALGDGHLSSTGELRILHCAAQKEYLKYKANLLGANVHYKNNNGRDAYVCAKDVFTNFNGHEIRKKLYGVVGHKYLTQDIVDEMDLFCWAILYLDDGSLYAKKRDGKIHAYELVISIYGTQEECKRLINHLRDRYNLRFTLKFNKGKYSIRCGTREARKFLALIREQVPDFACFRESKLLHI